MSSQLHITSTAEHDIMRAVDYIEFTLKNPQAADNLLDAVTKQIGTLSDFPQKFRLVDDPVLASWEIRFVIINNYLQSILILNFLNLTLPFLKERSISLIYPHFGHLISIFPVVIVILSKTHHSPDKAAIIRINVLVTCIFSFQFK